MAKITFSAIKKRLFGNYEWIVDFTDVIPKYDVKKCRISAMLGYLCFFIPMTMHDDRQFARFHANQSILNLIMSTVITVIWGMIPYVGIYLMILQELLCIIFTIRGMVLSYQGKARSIPLVGWITIYPYRYPGQ